MSMFIGEALSGDGNEIAHIDLLIGEKTGPVGVAFANALANQSAGQHARKSGDEEDLRIHVVGKRDRPIERARQADVRAADERRRQARHQRERAEPGKRNRQARTDGRHGPRLLQDNCVAHWRLTGTTVRWPARSWKDTSATTP